MGVVSLNKEWKIEGSLFCTGIGCDEFPQCSGCLNMAIREFNCEIEFHGTVTEVKEENPIKRKIPCLY